MFTWLERKQKNLHCFSPVAEPEVAAIQTSHNSAFTQLWVNPRCYKDIFTLRTIKFLTWLDGGIPRWRAGTALNQTRRQLSALCWEEPPLFPITTPSSSDEHFPELAAFLFGLGWRRGAYEIDRRWALISDWSVEQWPGSGDYCQ